MTAVEQTTPTNYVRSNRMSEQPVRPALHTGNPHDDDALIIDSDFLEVDALPDKVTTVNIVQTEPSERPAKTNRLLIGTITFPAGGFPSPYQALPLDANRLHLKVKVYSPTNIFTDQCRIGDDGNKLTALIGSHIVTAGSAAGGVFDPDDYTGPLFLYAPDCTAPLVVSWMAVTS